MAKEKTVVLFVRHIDEAQSIDKVFTEATEVGKDRHYETPSKFINAFAKIYRSGNFGEGVSFSIVDVKIG